MQEILNQLITIVLALITMVSGYLSAQSTLSPTSSSVSSLMNSVPMTHHSVSTVSTAPSTRAEVRSAPTAPVSLTAPRTANKGTRNITAQSITRPSSLSKHTQYRPAGTSRKSAKTIAPDGIQIIPVAPISTEKILEDTTQFPQRLNGNALRVRVAQNEYEPASVVLRNTTTADMDKIILVPQDLHREDGTAFAASRITVRVVKVWLQNKWAWVSIGRNSSDVPVRVPELLLNNDNLITVDGNTMRIALEGRDPAVIDNFSIVSGSQKNLPAAEFPIRDADTLQPLTLSAGETKQFWITVDGNGASPGVYEGVLALHRGGTEIGSVALTVEVLPFSLKEPEIEYSLYYLGRIDTTDGVFISDIKKTPQQFRADMENIRAHGVSYLTTYARSDLSTIIQEQSIKAEVGLPTDVLYYIDLKRHGEELAAHAPKILDVARSAGASDVYFYGIDEARGDALTKQRSGWEKIHALGGKVFAAGYHWKGAFELAGDMIDTFIASKEPIKEEAAKFHSVGHRLFSYANPQVGLEDPLLYRKNYGIVLWQNDYDGVMDYAYQDAMNHPYNDSDHKQYRDHMFTYPTLDTPIDTIAWEGFREAYDDMRYIATLSADIKRSSGSAAQKAKEYLNTLKNGPVPSDMDAMRETIIQHILAIRARSGN